MKRERTRRINENASVCADDGPIIREREGVPELEATKWRCPSRDQYCMESPGPLAAIDPCPTMGVVMVERRALAREGIVVVSLAVSKSTGKLVGKPRILSTGFVHSADAPTLFEDTSDELQAVIDRASKERLQWSEMEELVRTSVGKFLARRTKRNPLIVPVTIDV